MVEWRVAWGATEDSEGGASGGKSGLSKRIKWPTVLVCACDTKENWFKSLPQHLEDIQFLAKQKWVERYKKIIKQENHSVCLKKKKERTRLQCESKSNICEALPDLLFLSFFMLERTLVERKKKISLLFHIHGSGVSKIIKSGKTS